MKKTVLITGASRGIGRAIALECAKGGYDTVVTCRKSELELNNVIKESESLGASCTGFVGDIGNPQDVKQLKDILEEKQMHIDVLVNNAGVSYLGLLSDMSDEEWDSIIATNLSSVFYCTRAVIPGMVQRQCGKIINISSMWGSVGASCEVAYSATKGGVNTFTKALAKELAPSNIQVNALALGVIDTEMNKCFDDDEKKALMEEIPAGRMGSPQEIAKIVVDMMTGKEYMTGQIIGVDGGMI